MPLISGQGHESFPANKIAEVFLSRNTNMKGLSAINSSSARISAHRIIAMYVAAAASVPSSSTRIFATCSALDIAREVSEMREKSARYENAIPKPIFESGFIRSILEDISNFGRATSTVLKSEFLEILERQSLVNFPFRMSKAVFF